MSGELPASLLLIGAGRMGGAMLAGWLESGLAPDRVFVVEPAAALRDDLPAGVHAAADADGLPDDLAPEAVVVAIKPQMMGEALPAYRRLVAADTVFLSIAAGTTVASFAKLLGEDARIVRAMPNTPAAIGRGMLVGYAAPGVDERQRAVCDTLLGAVGEVAWIEDEALMDAVTALSGSGPAYVFHLVEAMAAGGVAAGLPEALAMQLARATVSGAGELLRRAPDDAATLRENVTSPGGTTAAALAVLMDEPGLTGLLSEAIAAAAKRSRDLSG